MQNELLVKIGFPFARNFIPRGHTTARTEWFRGECSASIRMIEPVETQLAFRVRFPPRPPRNPKFRNRFPDYLVPAVELDLPSYDGAVWWPFWTWHEDFDLGDEFSVEQLRILLEEDYDIFQFLPQYGLVDHDSGSIESAREICRDDEDLNLSIATERVKANFLICDGRPYVRGGIPLYVNDWIKGERTFRLTVGEAGADRAVYPAVCTTFSNQHLRRQTTFRSGNFWIATDRAGAMAQAGARDTEVATIEVFAADLVEDVRSRLRLDAIFRDTLALFERPPGVPRLIKKQSAAAIDILATAREVVDDALLSKRRYEALSQVFSLEGFTYEPLKQLYRDFRSLERQLVLDPLFVASYLESKNELATNDDEPETRHQAVKPAFPGKAT